MLKIKKAERRVTFCLVHVSSCGYVCEQILAYMSVIGAGEENRTLVISLEG